MYNGIGLATARGSGTSGYIQRNLSFIRPQRTDFEVNGFKKGFNNNGKMIDGGQGPKVRKGNNELLLHERRRKIESDLLQFRDELEAQGVVARVIEDRVHGRRVVLTAQLDQELAGTSNPSEVDVEKMDSHQSAQLKTRELENVRKAFGLAQDYGAKKPVGNLRDLQHKSGSKRSAVEADEGKDRANGTVADGEKAAVREADRLQKEALTKQETTHVSREAGAGDIDGRRVNDEHMGKRVRDRDEGKNGSQSPRRPRKRSREKTTRETRDSDADNDRARSGQTRGKRTREKNERAGSADSRRVGGRHSEENEYSRHDSRNERTRARRNERCGSADSRRGGRHSEEKEYSRHDSRIGRTRARRNERSGSADSRRGGRRHSEEKEYSRHDSRNGPTRAHRNERDGSADSRRAGGRHSEGKEYSQHDSRNGRTRARRPKYSDSDSSDT